MIRIGIIGCGWIVEKAYLPILKKINDIEVNAVFDSDYQKACEVQNKHSISNAFGIIEDLLSSPIDAVIIATPNNTHTYYSDLALNAGKHVLCEKPVALSKEDIESTILIAGKNNKIFIPAFVNRFRSDIQKFSELVSLIGDIKEVEVNWIRKSGIPKPGTWITNKASAGGGVLIDIGTHILDIALMFISDKCIKTACLSQGARVNAEQEGASWNKDTADKKLTFDVETWAKGKVVFENDSTLLFNVSWAEDVDEDITEIKVLGTDGIAFIKTLFGFSNNFKRDNIKMFYETDDDESKTISLPMKNTFALNAFESLIRYFVGSICGQAMNKLNSSDSVYVVDIIDKLYHAAKAEQEKSCIT